MIDTLNSIASQPDAQLKICAFVGLEEGTPDKDRKSQELQDLFCSKFERFIVTIHPKNLPGDIPGKCSNFNYSARASVKKLRTENVINQFMLVLVTTGDCDTVFGERYFDALEEDYWKTNPNAREMFLTRSEYDRGVNTFSPEGRLFQVEYAIETVKLGATSIGIRTKAGVVLAAEKRATSSLLVNDSINKISKVDDHIATTFAGLIADSRTLVNHARQEAQSFW